MCEVTTENFRELYDGIVSDLKNATFVAIDTEFNANPSDAVQSLFDTIDIRYNKQRKKICTMIPMQVGLTAFTFDRDNYSYFGSTYTFYVYPPSFSYINKTFNCDSSSLRFLSEHEFDFNKWIKYGISYLTRNEEIELRENFKNNIAFNNLRSSVTIQTEEKLSEIYAILVNWLSRTNNDNDMIYILDGDDMQGSEEFKYFLHKSIREKFKHTLWTFDKNNKINVHKVSKQEYEKLETSYELEENLVQYFLGFSKIFRLLTELKHPLIGHNLLTDLLLVINTFEQTLPNTYSGFKRLVNELFPSIYDTKVLSKVMSTEIPLEKRGNTQSLKYLYEYFKNGHGRHLVMNSPLIEPVAKKSTASLEEAEKSLKRNVNSDCFHNAGWDSYCTGYAFIRIAHLCTAKKYVDKCNRNFVSSELFHSLESWKNQVNLTRGSLSHLQFDGADPVSKRPPLLLAQAVKNTSVTLPEVINMLKPLGYIEVIPHRTLLKRNSYLVAVDNYYSMRRILAKFNNKKANECLYVTQFNYMKHSAMARAVIWGSLVMSGGLLAYVTHSVLFKT